MSLEGKEGRGNRRGGVRGGGGGVEYCIAERRRENDKIKIIFFSYKKKVNRGLSLGIRDINN